MDQRISLVTLGVDDLDAASAFYERLGWRRSLKDLSGVRFFQCGGLAFSLYPREKLAVDAGLAPEAGRESIAFRPVTFAVILPDKPAVDATLAQAEAAGATITKPAQDAFWGGYHGYFRDPEGYFWEIAWNPGFKTDAAGNVVLPD